MCMQHLNSTIPTNKELTLFSLLISLESGIMQKQQQQHLVKTEKKSLSVVPDAKRIPAAATPAVPSPATTDANVQLYQALMQHKQKEQQMVSCILRDARLITDAMVQKQRDAQLSQVVVSAVGDQYVTNARYIQINSGLEPKISVFSQVLDMFIVFILEKIADFV